MFGEGGGVMNVAGSPPEERKCEGVVSDGKSRKKKSFQLPPQILHMCCKLKMLCRGGRRWWWVEGGGGCGWVGGEFPKCRHDVRALEEP